MNPVISTLGDLTDLITKGTTPTSIGFDFAEQGVPFIRVQNISDGRVNWGKDTLFIAEQTHSAMSRSKVQPNDLMISIAGTIGRVGIVSHDSPSLNCNQAVAIVRLRDSVSRSLSDFPCTSLRFPLKVMLG